MDSIRQFRERHRTGWRVAAVLLALLLLIGAVFAFAMGTCHDAGGFCSEPFGQAHVLDGRPRSVPYLPIIPGRSSRSRGSWRAAEGGTASHREHSGGLVRPQQRPEPGPAHEGMDVTYVAVRSRSGSIVRYGTALIIASLIVGLILARLVSSSADYAVPPTFLGTADVDDEGLATLATIYIDNSQKQAVTVESVKLLSAKGIELEGVDAVLPRDVEELGGYDGGGGYPPPGYEGRLHPALGKTFHPDDFEASSTWPLDRIDLQLVLKLRATASGIAAANGIEVVYEMGGETHHQRFPHAIVVCKSTVQCQDVNGDEALEELGLIPAAA